MKIVFLLNNFTCGGVERNTLVLTSLLGARGHDVKLVVCENTGPLKDRLDHEHVDLHVLRRNSKAYGKWLALKADPGAILPLLMPVLLTTQPPRPIQYLASLVEYLQDTRPDVIVAATPHINLMAIWARRLAGIESRLVIGERIQIHHYLSQRRGWRHNHLLPLLGRCYLQADTIIAVSNAVADELADAAGIDRSRIRTVYNPVVTQDLMRETEVAEHPWFAPGEPPVILGTGRLSEQKDFPTLVRAFSLVRKQRECRLIILGEAGNPNKTAKRQQDLLNLARELGVWEDVALPGFVDNPHAWMRGARVFAMSSLYEGLPTVLIEAMACGTPVVSTNYPGASEILENGKWGKLVPVRDHQRLAEAIISLLDTAPAGKTIPERVQDFTAEHAADQYERLLAEA